MLRAFVITLLDFIVKIIFFVCIIGGVFVGGHWREFVGQSFLSVDAPSEDGAVAGAVTSVVEGENANLSEPAFNMLGAAVGGVGGLVIGVLACGMAFVLLDIRAQTQRTADLLQKIDDNDHP